jgi:hypothetical protein
VISAKEGPLEAVTLESLDFALVGSVDVMGVVLRVGAVFVGPLIGIVVIVGPLIVWIGAIVGLLVRSSRVEPHAGMVTPHATTSPPATHRTRRANVDAYSGIGSLSPRLVFAIDWTVERPRRARLW